MSRPLRVALLANAAAAEANRLAAGLRLVGQQSVLMVPGPVGASPQAGVQHLRRLPGRPLRFRHIGDGFAHLPHAYAVLARGRFDLAHAFGPVDALAAVAWARRAGGAAVLTFVAPLERETIGNRRLRLTTLERAVGGADRVLAASDEVSASLRRLLAIEASVIAPSDAAGHLSLYRELSPLRPRVSPTHRG